MKSIKTLYKIGFGPSSSHTMGPSFAAATFLSLYPQADFIQATLFGSLSKTGKGHGTDRAISETLKNVKHQIIFDYETETTVHPNTIEFIAFQNNLELGRKFYYSIGGGEIKSDDAVSHAESQVYPHNKFSDIADFCKAQNIRLSDYVFENEGPDIKQYLLTVWKTMQNAINEGLSKSGTLPGGLSVERKAQFLFNQKHIDESPQTRENRLVCSYAFAVSEQNADCGVIVTAPTCGSCGVLPAVLKYMQDKNRFTDDDMIRGLAVAGLVGNVVATNASISGAECGCQAEVGTACSMAAAALGELFEMGIDQIEYAAEVAMEHHLGLTCDPVCGLVQIPCIERNAVAAMRAINALSLANFLFASRKVSFDVVVETMYQTGKDLSHLYRETSEGGLAKLYTNKS
ncbi:MAG: L-serine ammonia-lyase [Ruminococcaceae bacterium]|nr:L-serine ammonia-lyase [Oscillospiraceae bacterium]